MHSHFHATSASLLSLSHPAGVGRTVAAQRTLEVRLTSVTSSSWFEMDDEGVEALTIDGWAGSGSRPRRGLRSVPREDQTAEGLASEQAATEEAISLWA